MEVPVKHIPNRCDHCVCIGRFCRSARCHLSFHGMMEPVATNQDVELLEAPDAAPWGAPLSARDAAALLGVSERTVRRAIARGELPAIKHAGVYRIRPAILDRNPQRPTAP